MDHADIDGDTGIERAKLDDRELRKQMKGQQREARKKLKGREQGG